MILVASPHGRWWKACGSQGHCLLAGEVRWLAFPGRSIKEAASWLVLQMTPTGICRQAMFNRPPIESVKACSQQAKTKGKVLWLCPLHSSRHFSPTRSRHLDTSIPTFEHQKYQLTLQRKTNFQKSAVTFQNMLPGTRTLVKNPSRWL